MSQPWHIFRRVTASIHLVVLILDLRPVVADFVIPSQQLLQSIDGPTCPQHSNEAIPFQLSGEVLASRSTHVLFWVDGRVDA